MEARYLAEAENSKNRLNGLILGLAIDTASRAQLLDDVAYLHHQLRSVTSKLQDCREEIAVQSAQSSPTGKNTLTSAPASAADTPTGSQHDDDPHGDTKANLS